MVNQATFKHKVYALVKQIPAGKVATYGQIAQIVGSSGAARAVGMCMRQNLDPKVVPCHRVVGSDGKLTGYAFGGIEAKYRKLITEGVAFNDKAHVNLEISQWNPEKM